MPNQYTTPIPPEKRFWSLVNKSGPVPGHCPELGPCWNWTGAGQAFGYGTIKVVGKIWKAHRFAWHLSNGPIPEGVCVLHRCDNPACVNHEHLFLGDRATNWHDCVAKGRNRPASLRGERNPRSKLKEKDIVNIRTSRKDGITIAALAKRYGVHRVIIHGIVHRKGWKHVP